MTALATLSVALAAALVTGCASSVGSNWTKLEGTGPVPARWAHAAAVVNAESAAGGSAWLFGGCASLPMSDSVADLLSCREPVGDMWLRTPIQTGEWSLKMSSSTSAPSNRSLAASAVDVNQDNHWYLFGGTSSKQALDGLWRFSPSGWQQLEAKNALAPSPRLGASMVYVVGELLLYGGCTESGRASSASSGLYAFDVSGAHDHQGKWLEIKVDTKVPQPQARCLHSAASYAGEGGVPFMLMYGGIGANGEVLDDGLWRLDVLAARWEKLTPRGPVPAATFGASANVLQSDGHPVASLVMAGGLPSPGHNSTSVEYDMLVNEWQYRSNIWPKPRGFAGPALRGSEPPGYFIIHGGLASANGSQGRSTWQILDDTWQYSIGDAPGSTAGYVAI